MLRLSKARDLDTIQITVREKERALNVSLVAALGLATLFHVLALMTFRVVGPADKPCGSAPPPSSVVVDLGVGQDLDAEGATVQRLLSRHPAPQEPVPHDLWAVEAEDRYDFENNLHGEEEGSQFLQIDLIPYEANRSDMRFSHTHTPVTVGVKGVLAEHPWKTDTLGTLSTPRPTDKTTKSYAVSYQVLMDARTGKIFWYDNVEKQAPEGALRIATSLLQKLSFQEDSESTEIVRGTVEFQFDVEEGKDFTDFFKELGG